ncbi:Hypothetical predicted protein [Pelobates cultripes]|uniref:Uncharacterized protein n=1 Tax=Pelobates cultripes TaxID=61616 RepID=A0AAD1R8C8_PELCU|nr:Hypothetical predicted protein [Pelobates cultripes]
MQINIESVPENPVVPGIPFEGFSATGKSDLRICGLPVTRLRRGGRSHTAQTGASHRNRATDTYRMVHPADTSKMADELSIQRYKLQRLGTVLLGSVVCILQRLDKVFQRFWRWLEAQIAHW